MTALTFAFCSGPFAAPQRLPLPFANLLLPSALPPLARTPRYLVHAAGVVSLSVPRRHAWPRVIEPALRGVENVLVAANRTPSVERGGSRAAGRCASQGDREYGAAAAAAQLRIPSCIPFTVPPLLPSPPPCAPSGVHLLAGGGERRLCGPRARPRVQRGRLERDVPPGGGGRLLHVRGRLQGRLSSLRASALPLAALAPPARAQGEAPCRLPSPPAAAGPRRRRRRWRGPSRGSRSAGAWWPSAQAPRTARCWATAPAQVQCRVMYVLVGGRGIPHGAHIPAL